MKGLAPASIKNIPGIFEHLYGAVNRPTNLSALPTVSFSSSAMGSAQTIYANSNTGTDSPNTTNFGIYGAALSQMRRRSTAVTQNRVLANDMLTELTYVFYTAATDLDLICYGSGYPMDVWVDDQYLGHYDVAIDTGTAQAGAASTITLKSGSSATNGFYNTCYVRITGGTGVLNEVRKITGYVGSTKVATVASNWTTNPDATTTYSIEPNANGFVLDGLTGSLKYLHQAFNNSLVKKITVVSKYFYGINVGPNDSVWPGPPTGLTKLIVCGDSFWAGTAGPNTCPSMSCQLSRAIGAQLVNLSFGTTGWCGVNSTSVSNVNFMDRLFPPTESWELNNLGTAGTYTLSVTYGGSTQTTGALAYNATAATVLTAVQGLSNMTPANIQVVSGEIYHRQMRFVFSNMPGAVLTIDTSGLTGSATLTPWTGDLAPNVPVDGNGVQQPFILFMPGSGNDYGSFSTGQVQTNASYVAARLRATYPTAIPIWAGQVQNVQHGASNTIDATDLARNAALSAAAAAFGTVNGKTPFIDTYAAGNGGVGWISGASNVGTPTANKNDIYVSLTASGHPTGPGVDYWSIRMAYEVKKLLGPA